MTYINRYLSEYISTSGRGYVITQEDIDKFVKILETSRSRKTEREHLRYLTRALKELNFTLTPESFQDYLTELVEEYGEKSTIPRDVGKALKKFINSNISLETSTYLTYSITVLQYQKLNTALN